MCMPLSSTRVVMACMLGMVLVALVMVLGGHESMLCLATASSARCTKARTRPTGHRHLPSTWRRNSAAPGTRQRGVPGTAAVAAAREAVPAPGVLPKETALTMKPRGLIISIHSTKVISNNDFMISCVFCQAICAGVFGGGCDDGSVIGIMLASVLFDARAVELVIRMRALFRFYYKKLVNKTRANHERYAAAHGYEYRYLSTPVPEFESRDIRWHKVIFTLKMLDEGYPWVFWTDSDALFTNCKLDPIATWVKGAEDFVFVRDHHTIMNSGQYW